MANSKMKKGDRFHEWTVLDPNRRLSGRMRADGTSRSYAAALVRCSCGTEKVIHQHHIRSGNTKSCGHYRETGEWRPQRRKRMTLKAEIRVNVNPVALADRQVIRRTWSSIKDRCFNPGNPAWSNYGGRGITMHPAWASDPDAFTDWILENIGPRPEGCSIDRIDVNGNYEPGNLRWATAFEQMQNTRSQLDPLNGVTPTPGASTFGYTVQRQGLKFAEYGFETPADAARGRDDMLAVLDAEGPDAALKLIRSRSQARRDERQETWRLAREEAEKKAAEARRLRDEAREEKRLAQEMERVAKRSARQDRKAERAARWHEMNKTMTLADIARAEGVSVAHVSIELKRHGYEATAHNATGYPGVKKITRNGRTYFEARTVIDGKRKTLGQRKTPEEAHALYLAARAATDENAGQ